jgi:hypothetical protein
MNQWLWKKFDRNEKKQFCQMFTLRKVCLWNFFWEFCNSISESKVMEEKLISPIGYSKELPFFLLQWFWSYQIFIRNRLNNEKMKFQLIAYLDKASNDVQKLLLFFLPQKMSFLCTMSLAGNSLNRLINICMSVIAWQRSISSIEMLLISRVKFDCWIGCRWEVDLIVFQMNYIS